MSNPSKKKGTAGEVATVKWLHAHGFPFADRQPLRGNRDAGDIAVSPGLVLEVKAHAIAGNGQVPPGVLATWMSQAEAERVNAGADHCPLVVKRSGTADVGRWFAYMPAWGFAALVGVGEPAEFATPTIRHAPLCTDVASLAYLLRWAGYGSPLEDDELIRPMGYGSGV